MSTIDINGVEDLGINIANTNGAKNLGINIASNAGYASLFFI